MAQHVRLPLAIPASHVGVQVYKPQQLSLQSSSVLLLLGQHRKMALAGSLPPTWEA